MAARVPPQSIAARVLTAVVVNGRYLDGALNDLRGEAAELAPLVQEMTYGVARRYFSLNALAALLLKEPLKERDQDLRLLLLTGLYQLREMRTPEARAVNETVQAAVTLGKPWARGMINACLRRHQREREQLEAALVDETVSASSLTHGPRLRPEVETVSASSLTHGPRLRPEVDEARHDHPRWLLEQLRATWPDDWEAIVAANNRRPPLWLRVNRQRITRDEVLTRFAERHLQAQTVDHPDSALLVDPPQPVEAIPGFSDGLMSVQDAAAQFAAPLLDARPGERVLDACAAPGGKTAHLLELTPGLDLLALDIAPDRVARIRDNLGRLGLTAEVRAADATRPDGWWDGRAFDRILLDAPCSASGVIRRHPDVKLRRRPADLPRLLTTQQTLLESLWPLLKPGGKLLYVTCSILPDENELAIARFLEHHPDAREWPLRLPAGRARPHGWQLLPIDILSADSAAFPVDGFFYAGLTKAA